MAAIELGLAEYDRDRIHHLRLTRAAVEDVFRTLATESGGAASPQPRARAGPGRRDRRRRDRPRHDPAHVDFDELLVSEADILDGLVRSLAPTA